MSHALTASSATADASDSEARRERPARSAARGGIAPRSTVGAAVAARAGRVMPRTSLGSRRTTSSAIARALVRCEMSSTVAPPIGEPRGRCATARASVVGVERGARLVERDHARPPRAGAGRTRGRRRRAAPGRPTGPRPARRAPASGSRSPAHASVERRVARARASGAGSPSATFVGDRPGDQARAAAPPTRASRAARGRATSRTAVGRRAVERRGAAQGGEDAGLAGAARSLEQGDGARVARSESTGGRARSPRCTRDVARARGRPRGARGSRPELGARRRATTARARRPAPSKTSSVAATPSAAAWNCTPTWRSGRYASGASSSTNRPTASASEPSSSRKPIDTAMIATEMLARNSRANPDRNDTRSTCIVSRR